MLKAPLQLYTVFHLNLSYSSIEEEQRPEVVQRCYWPLLQLAREYNLPLGIEASGYTLETAAAIDPAWLKELRRLTTEGPCEFVGSGYAQIIGPLVPAEVNGANLRLGHQVYERLLGIQPQVALVNEQAYSCGLIQHYLDADYRAIIMEWDNPAQSHAEWDPEWRYLPQIACGQHGEEIPLIWNKSIAFQKLQRYAHGEMELDEYVDYLLQHLAGTPRAFPLYGNDVEVFNFRPGRYHTETVLQGDNEWKRIRRLFEALLSDNRFQFIPPGQVLNLTQVLGADNCLHLERSQQPIPVKKQGKYNITRWGVTGRDDLGINTACWRMYEELKGNHETTDDHWRELCYLWSSDFRTHITEKRWMSYLEQLKMREKQVDGDKLTRTCFATFSPTKGEQHAVSSSVQVERNGRYLTVETSMVKVRLNCRRGLAVDRLWFKNFSDHWLCGMLDHGYYDEINWGADYYTGHLVLETPGQPKITDLSQVEPEITEDPGSGQLCVCATINTILGTIEKHMHVSRDSPRLEISYHLSWSQLPAGSLRLGHVTLNPEAFDCSSLFYATHNGGSTIETFPLRDQALDHGAPVSFLVSASHGLGMTGGYIVLGDSRRQLRVEVSHTTAALLGMITYCRVRQAYFYRLSFSAGEIDDTSRTCPTPLDSQKRIFSLALLPDQHIRENK